MYKLPMYSVDIFDFNVTQTKQVTSTFPNYTSTRRTVPIIPGLDGLGVSPVNWVNIILRYYSMEMLGLSFILHPNRMVG